MIIFLESVHSDSNLLSRRWAIMVVVFVASALESVRMATMMHDVDGAFSEDDATDFIR